MPLVLLVLLVAGVVVEVWAAVRVADLIGAAPTALLLVASSLLGARVLSRGAVRAWRRLSTAAQGGEPVGRRVADTGLVVVAGGLLLVPGLISGVLGLLLLLPPVRAVVRPVLGTLILRRFALPVALGARGAGWAAGRARASRAGGPVDLEGHATDRPGHHPGAPTVLPPRAGDGDRADDRGPAAGAPRVDDGGPAGSGPPRH